VLDYTAALDIKKVLLPPSSRALASAHYQLSSALELTPAGRPAALEHVQAALDGFKARADELRRAIAGEKAADDVERLSEREREAELKDVSELIGDLEVKIDELKIAPPREDLVSGTINHLLGGIGGEVKQDAGPVNDLTSMVRKKKRPAPEKVEDKGDKKAKVEEK
jgi:HAT1-interacting factor 1